MHHRASKTTGFISFILLISCLSFSGILHAGYEKVSQSTQFQVPGEVHEITLLNQNKALLAAYGEGIILVDLSKPHTPQVIHTSHFSKQAESIALSRNQQIIYVANGSAGLDILKLASNGQMTLLGRMDTPSYAFDVTISPNGRAAYIADNDSGVIIADVSNPAKPKKIAHIPSQASSASVTLTSDGRFLFIADQARGIKIANVSNPASPRLLKQFSTQGHAQDIALSNDGKRLFSANNTGGLQIFDMTNLQQPKNMGTAKTSNAFGVTLSRDNRIVFIADLFGGIKIIDITNPEKPVTRQTLKTDGNPEKIKLHNNGKTVFIADGKSGITIITFY